jgi:hypothetical protein
MKSTRPVRWGGLAAARFAARDRARWREGGCPQDRLTERRIAMQRTRILVREV